MDLDRKERGRFWGILNSIKRIPSLGNQWLWFEAGGFGLRFEAGTWNEVSDQCLTNIFFPHSTIPKHFLECETKTSSLALFKRKLQSQWQKDVSFENKY